MAPPSDQNDNLEFNPTEELMKKSNRLPVSDTDELILICKADVSTRNDNFSAAVRLLRFRQRYHLKHGLTSPSNVHFRAKQILSQQHRHCNYSGPTKFHLRRRRRLKFIELARHQLIGGQHLQRGHCN